MVLGQCCASGTQFRQAFGPVCTSELANLLVQTKDSGILCNALYALWQYVSDDKCLVDEDLCESCKKALPELLTNTNPKISFNANMLSSKLMMRLVLAPPVEVVRENTVLCDDAESQSDICDVSISEDHSAWENEEEDTCSPNAEGTTVDLNRESPVKKQRMLELTKDFLNHRRAQIVTPDKKTL